MPQESWEVLDCSGHDEGDHCATNPDSQPLAKESTDWQVIREEGRVGGGDAKEEGEGSGGAGREDGRDRKSVV